MKKIIGISIVVLAILVSCTKEDKGKPAPLQIYPIHYNSHMAKTIVGTNERWGDFKFIINYERGNMLTKSYRTNQKIDSVGDLSVSRSKSFSTNTYSINEVVNNISPDSVVRLDVALKEKYGVGNYSLQDSVSKASRIINQTLASYYSDGRTYKQIDKYFAPKENMGITDKEFDNTYYIRKMVTNFYEYNSDGYIVIDRVFEDEYYDITNDKIFNRKVFKYEVNYDKNRIVSFTAFELIAGENYTEIETYNYNYSDGKVISIIGNKGYRKTFEYSGANLKITEGSNVSNYQLTSFGYPSKIDDGKGSVMNVEYVDGHGELSNYVSFTDKLFGNPYIR